MTTMDQLREPGAGRQEYADRINALTLAAEIVTISQEVFNEAIDFVTAQAKVDRDSVTALQARLEYFEALPPAEQGDLSPEQMEPYHQRSQLTKDSIASALPL